MTALQALLEHVEKAEAPDRVIDAALGQLVRWPEGTDLVAAYDENGFRGRAVDQVGHIYGPPIYTASIDAAVALVEKALPGWMIINLSEWENERQRKRGRWMAQLKPIGTQDDLRVKAATCMHAPTPALALCAALLNALIASDA